MDMTFQAAGAGGKDSEGESRCRSDAGGMEAKVLLPLQIVETLTFVTNLFGRWEERLRDRATSPPSSQVGQAEAGEKERTQTMKSRWWEMRTMWNMGC